MRMILKVTPVSVPPPTEAQRAWEVTFAPNRSPQLFEKKVHWLCIAIGFRLKISGNDPLL